ncbi:PhoU domain-containing protein [Mycoplasmoides alvi]|uniref:PhoU domain-containing protein n=1 Tax=Mycoplasmoides alvi TaxID=78580 RepID=UPI00051B6F15|nr:PhoU domain-containing protein [Mycoplasmoides alvi]
MAINYGTLKQSEKELISKFYDYLEHTYQMHLKVLEALDSYEDLINKNKLLQEIYEMEKMSNIIHSDLLDESVWIISKEQPQASHLRFVIAIINSINDLERICDYANNLSKFLDRNLTIYTPALKVLKNLENKAIINYQKVFDFFKQNDASEAHKYVLELQKKFWNEYSMSLKTLKNIYVNENEVFNNNNNNTTEYFIELILAIKNIERIMDHVMNVVNHFVFIKESNFFFRKKD